MVRAYYYLFYRLYTFAKWVNVKDAIWTGMLFVTALNYFNLATIVFWIFPIEKVIILPVWTMAVVICVPLMIINYFIFLSKGKSNKIIALFEKESKSQKIISSILTVVYVALTLILAHW